jgi:hypothetical protein
VVRGGAVETGQCSASIGPVEVGTHQHREDVGLEEDHQQLEERHYDRHESPHRAEDHRVVADLEEVHRTEREDHQEHVTGEHVGEEPDGQRERPDDEVLQHLDRRHQDVHAPGHAGQERGCP